MQRSFVKAAVITGLFFTASCTEQPAKPKTAEINTDLEHFTFTVEEASDWNALFRRSSGWFGGDGMFVIPANGVDSASDDEESLILFSDTMIGEIEEDKLKPGYVMIHNSVASLSGSRPDSSRIRFHWDQKPDGKPESVFIPRTPATQPGDYYWLGDGFVNTEHNGDTYLFGYRIHDIKGAVALGFEHVGSTIIVIPKGSQPPFKDQRQIDFPFFASDKSAKGIVAFGSGILVNTTEAKMPHADGYAYIYGTRGKEKELLVARVSPGSFEQFDAWRFWDGKSWVAQMDSAAAVTSKVSNELSVSPLPDGRYALFFQLDGLTTTVGMRLGSSPVGPFGPVIKIFDNKAALVGKNFFSYNAKAHPALSKPGELLVSYHVNSFDFFNDIKLYPYLYSPRFVRVKYE